MKLEIDLKPCPVPSCGSEAQHATDGWIERTHQPGTFYVRCSKCGCCGPRSHVGPDEARRLWNSIPRPAPAAKGLVWDEPRMLNGIMHYQAPKLGSGEYRVFEPCSECDMFSAFVSNGDEIGDAVDLEAAKAMAEAHHQAAAAKLWKEWWGA